MNNNTCDSVTDKYKEVLQTLDKVLAEIKELQERLSILRYAEGALNAHLDELTEDINSLEMDDEDQIIMDSPDISNHLKP